MEIRKQWENFKEVPQSQPWFKVFDIGNDVLAIYEPYHFQEVISYLIKGKDVALLFDTGLGIGDMKKCVSELWNKKLIVTNSHRHFDHIGSNYEFDEVLVYNHPQMIEAMTKPLPYELIAKEYNDDQFFVDAPIKEYKYEYKPIKYKTFNEGYVFDLGNREFKVISTPGHAKDEIMLVNDKEKLLFTGDEYYLAPLYCFEDSFDEYIESMKMLKDKYFDYTLITSHNEPYQKGDIFKSIYEGFIQIKNNEVKPKEEYKESNRVLYEFDSFSIIKLKGN